MRILHLANHCDDVGNGIMNVAVDLACCQAAAGHTVALASGGGGSFAPLLCAHGVETVHLPQNWRRPLGLPRAVAGLWSLARRFRPDVVHAHMMTGAVLARAVRGGAPWGLVTTIHNDWQRSAVVMGLGDRVIAVSDAVAARMARRGIARERIDVVRNGAVGSPRRPPRTGPRADLGRPALLTVAGLYDRKGIGDLIAAFDRLADRHATLTLTIVGDGPERSRFEAQARASRGADRIRFTGFVADPRPYLGAADIFVLASRDEPFGLVLAEAREAGCAVVGTRVGGIPEVLESGRAGLLVPPRDPVTLADTLDGLISDPAALARWRQAAREGLSWLDVRRAAAETVQVYERAARARRPRPSAPIPVGG
ncbi:glycosyltransferase family 4 protein [Methylobacterium sp. JK268]